MDIHGDKIMQVKQTTIALLICSLFVSGSALARHGGGLDVDVDDSFQNTDTNSHNVDKSDNNSFNDTDSYNTDKSDNNSFNDTDSYNDTNSYNTDKSDNNSYNDTDSNNKTYTKTYNKSYSKTDNSMDLDWSNDQQWSTTKNLTDKMIAKSSVKGKLENVSVSYSTSKSMGYKPYGRRGHGHGDSCCGGGDMTVSNSNTLTGANGAAGITSIAQNVGGNALAQQSVSINTK